MQEEPSPSRILQFSRELISGSIGGICMSLTGHPLDTVKVCMQSCNGSHSQSTLSNIKMIFKNEGFLGFYKGVSPPLLLTGISSAFLFAINGYMKRIVCSFNKENEDISLSQVILASQMTAPFYSLILTPIDVIKCRLQIQNQNEKIFKGPINCFFQTIRKEGLFNGIYRGYITTVSTRIVGLPFYFGTYHLCKRLFDNNFEDLGIFSYLVSGGAGGCAFWTANYPLDLIKTRIQSSIGKKNIIYVVKQVYNNGGVPNFYKGFLPCFIRAFISNATMFLGYEYTMKHL